MCTVTMGDIIWFSLDPIVASSLCLYNVFSHGNDKIKVDLVGVLEGVLSFAFLVGADWQPNVYNMVFFFPEY